jgi:selenoprotein W-related protein
LAATIKDTFNIEPELIEGRNGIFDVVADGTIVFSKHETDRFPDHAEVIDSLQDRGALPVKS